MAAPQPLGPDALYRHCDPARFSFRTTEELDDVGRVFGQDRAVDALSFGTGMRGAGYNIFVLGPNGIGKKTVVRHFLEQRAAGNGRPDDWCYVYNFERPDRPRLLRLRAGTGAGLAADLDALIEDFRTTIPSAFESEDYQRRLRELEQELGEWQEAAIADIRDEAEKHDIAVIQQDGEVSFAPRKDGRVLETETFHSLPRKERDRFDGVIARLREQLQEAVGRFPRWQRETRQRIRALNREVVDRVALELVSDIRDKYEGAPAVTAHVDAIRADVVDNAEAFRVQEEPVAQVTGPQEPSAEQLLKRYRANRLVDNAGQEGQPVIYEDLPTHDHLVGRIEHHMHQGALITDYSLIRSGALHRANGGLLLIDARNLLEQPFAWEGLKRALYAGRVTIESMEQPVSAVSTVTIEPEPMPLDVKVVLFGDRSLYYLLAEIDPDFGELFKVQADFEEDLARSEDNLDLYARLIGSIARKEGLRPLDGAGVARVIEHGSRLAEDRGRLTLHAGRIADLLREASYWAGEADRDRVTAADVQTAIDKQLYRASRIRETVDREIETGILMLDTGGSVRGQANALTVTELGGTAFGRPTRVTATARVGSGDVTDIEREVELSGAIHSKGVMILSAYLGSRYIPERPLSLAASLTFEQGYGEIDGDSASMAELAALLSEIADVPLSQAIAVTGSVNQKGRVQPVGGVNEKIEGFFDVCRMRGLTGRQGVIVPVANAGHLMLASRVREAVDDNRFRIWAVATVDEVIELMTGMEAGEADSSGEFPEGTFNRRVADRLLHFAEEKHRHDGDED